MTTFTTDASEDIVFYAGNSDITKDETNQMAAKLRTVITAQAYNDSPVKNFRDGCYAKDIDLKMTYATLGEDGLTPVVQYDDENASTSNSYAISQAPTDNSNPHQVMDLRLQKELFDAGEASEVIRINFDREKNKALNPIKLTICEVNATITDSILSKSTVPSAPSKTFLYLRAHVSSPQIGVGKEKDVLVDYEFYHDEDANQTVLTQCGLADAHESEDEVNWFKIDPALSAGLDYLQPKALFGATTHMTYAGPHHVSADTSNILKTNNTTMHIEVGKLPYKNKIVYKPSTEYLKYDRFNANVDTHSFKINLSPDTAKWTGKGDAGKTVDNNINKIGLKKVDW